MGLRVVFEDGVNRLAFCRTTIDRFVKQHQALVSKGASFKQLSEEERDGIVARARALTARGRIKLHAAARLIAEETNRAVETVRYTLRRHDESGVEPALFPRNGANVGGGRLAEIWRRHEGGESASALAAAFDCTVDEVERSLRQVQVRRWREQPLEYVPNELFDAPNADALILDAPEPANVNGPAVRVPRDVPPYLRSLYLTPLLSPELERDLFRRYNYLKYKVAAAVKALDPETAAAEAVGAIRVLLARVDELKQRIIRGNLRLVVSIAKKHVGWSSNLFEVISDGNLSLMRAVEKFDYARGYKFSTYASWAVVKNYARTIPERQYQCAKYVTGQEELLEAAADHREAPVSESDRGRLRTLIFEGLAALSDKERDILSNHFGLNEKGCPLTLEQLGRRFGVTKERIRQIERRALAHLRELLSPALADAV
jgi:RNA polymerase sigma factor (sigma-70 family)